MPSILISSLPSFWVNFLITLIQDGKKRKSCFHSGIADNGLVGLVAEAPTDTVVEFGFARHKQKASRIINCLKAFWAFINSFTLNGIDEWTSLVSVCSSADLPLSNIHLWGLKLSSRWMHSTADVDWTTWKNGNETDLKEEKSMNLDGDRDSRDSVCVGRFYLDGTFEMGTKYERTTFRTLSSTIQDKRDGIRRKDWNKKVCTAIWWLFQSCQFSPYLFLAVDLADLGLFQLFPFGQLLRNGKRWSKVGWGKQEVRCSEKRIRKRKTDQNPTCSNISK